MKKLLILALGVFFTATAFAQRYAIIDSRYILDKMPEYKQAQKSVETIAADWQKDIDARQAALDKLYDAYEAEQAMMSSDLKRKKRR